MRTMTPLSSWRALLAGAWAVAILAVHPPELRPAPAARADAASAQDELRAGTYGHEPQPSLAADAHVAGDAGRGDAHGAAALLRPDAAAEVAVACAWRSRARPATGGVSVLRTAPKTSPPVF